MASSVASPRKRSHSSSSDTAPTAAEAPSGPLSGPSDTTWRRQRLLHIGTVRTLDDLTAEQGAQDAGESTPIIRNRPVLQKAHSSYGTLPHGSFGKPGFRKRHGLPALPVLNLPGRVPSISTSPTTQKYGSLDRTSIFRSQRPISAYDAPFRGLGQPGESDLDAEGVRANGIRVWYSSFSSIDWLHDIIKDSTRIYRLRHRKSIRGRMRNVADRLMGWIIVTIVGFLVAVTAFLIVRSEQWLFDIKYGYCTAGWWKARRFCCPSVSDTRTFALGASSEVCSAWLPWGEAFTNTRASQLSQTLVGRATYSLAAVRPSRAFLAYRFPNPRSSFSRWPHPPSPSI
jgi:chloride channel 3/4/5